MGCVFRVYSSHSFISMLVYEGFKLYVKRQVISRMFGSGLSPDRNIL
jgi:hypothetical protein